MKFIPVKLGEGRIWAIVDDHWYYKLKDRKWNAAAYGLGREYGVPSQKYYANTNRRDTDPEGPNTLLMHRIIANTPEGMVCHHKNGFGRDNRECNLINMTGPDHSCLHSKLPRPFCDVIGETIIPYYDPGGDVCRLNL